MRIALAQVDVFPGDVDANLARAAKAVDDAREAGADAVLFPELHLSGYRIGGFAEDVALYPRDPRIVEVAARGEGMGVLLGFPELSNSAVHVYNSAAWFQGPELVHLHRKLYLPTYGMYEERKHFTPGPNLRAFDTPKARVATLICNDAWQPMLPFVAVHDGARVLLVPSDSAQSHFPERYDNQTYWRDLISFYGRMYQCFVVYVNRVGSEGELSFWGGSHVVDPWGLCIGEAELDEEALLVVDLDLAQVVGRRRAVPLLKEARFALLGREINRLAHQELEV